MKRPDLSGLAITDLDAVMTAARYAIEAVNGVINRPKTTGTGEDALDDYAIAPLDSLLGAAVAEMTARTPANRAEAMTRAGALLREFEAYTTPAEGLTILSDLAQGGAK